jgi:rod shape-determining protein MreC
MASGSQRAQRVAYTAGLLVFCSAVLTAYSVRTPSFGSRLSGFVVGITAPILEIQSSVTGAVEASFVRFGELSAAADNNLRLRQQNASLQAQLTKLNEYKLENERLRGLLNMADSLAIGGPVARVIGMSNGGWSNVVTIDKGSDAGVVVGNPVVAADGVVGRVIATSSTAAQILPIVDPKSSADALLQQTRVRGVLEGGGLGGCSLRFVTSRDSVTVGDMIVTSGFDGVFPPGLALGRVTRIENSQQELFHRIDVEPAANFSRIEQVMVITGPAPVVTQGPEVP